MLRLIKYKILMFIMGATCLTICSLIISMTGVEMYVDVKKHSDPDNTTPFPVHKILACSIFCLVNVLIFGHMLYLVLYALRGLRYTWYVSCNYFMYVLSEIVSVVVIITYNAYLLHPAILSILVAILAVLLFLITYVAQLIFEALEDRYVIENDIIMYRKVFSRSIRRTSQRKKAVQCVTISLYEKGVNKSATTSGIQEKRSTASTVAN